MIKKHAKIPHACCANCHFLVRRELAAIGLRARGDGKSYRVVLSAVSQEDRTALVKGNQVDNTGSLSCFKEVWRAIGKSSDQQQDVQATIYSNRGESCFFYPFTKGMDWEAAAELERRTSDRREASRDRLMVKRSIRWTVIGVIMAAVIGATITALLSAALDDHLPPSQEPKSAQPSAP